MKKTYEKPLVCCEKFNTGEIITNSETYAESVKKKIAEMEKDEAFCLFRRDVLQNGSRKE